MDAIYCCVPTNELYIAVWLKWSKQKINSVTDYYRVHYQLLVVNNSCSQRKQTITCFPKHQTYISIPYQATSQDFFKVEKHIQREFRTNTIKWSQISPQCWTVINDMPKLLKVINQSRNTHIQGHITLQTVNHKKDKHTNNTYPGVKSHPTALNSEEQYVYIQQFQ